MDTVILIIGKLKSSLFMLSFVNALNTMLILMTLQYAEFWNKIKK